MVMVFGIRVRSGIRARICHLQSRMKCVGSCRGRGGRNRSHQDCLSDGPSWRAKLRRHPYCGQYCVKLRDEVLAMRPGGCLCLRQAGGCGSPESLPLMSTPSPMRSLTRHWVINYLRLCKLQCELKY